MLMLLILILFGLWLKYRLKASDRSQIRSSDRFWKNENQANSTRRQPLDTIKKIHIPLDRLPMLEHPDSEIAMHQEQIRELSSKPIASFQGQSNTDLKLTYGAANLDALTQYEQNYTQLLRTLCQWGQALYDEELYAQAQTVLEFGVQCRTDISKHYTLLAEIYKRENRPDKISDLIAAARKLDSLMKPAIVKSLNGLLESCQIPE